MAPEKTNRTLPNKLIRSIANTSRNPDRNRLSGFWHLEEILCDKADRQSHIGS